MNSDDGVQVDDIFRQLDEKKSKKKKVNSKKKGSRGELKACKILSEHFGMQFNKTPDSGAFGTAHKLDQQALETLTKKEFIFQ